MPTTQLGIPTPPDSTKVSAFPHAVRAGLDKVDELIRGLNDPDQNFGYVDTPTDADSMKGIEWSGNWTIYHHDAANAPELPTGADPVWMVKIRQASTAVTEQTWIRTDTMDTYTRLGRTINTWEPYVQQYWAKGRLNRETYPTLDDVPQGYTQVWTSADATAYEMPFTGVGEIHKYAYGSVQHIFATAFFNGRMRMWATSKNVGQTPVWSEIGADPDPSTINGLQAATTNGFKVVAIPCSLGRSVGTTTGQGYARVLQRFPEGAQRVRVSIRNVNPRFDTADSPAMSLNDISIGIRSAGAGNSTNWHTLAATGSTGTDGYLSPWITVPIDLVGADLDVLIGYGWQSAEAVQLTYGTVYTGAVATDALTGTGVRGSEVPGFVAFEVEVPSTKPVVAVFGDSISTAVGSLAPVYYSWLDQWTEGKGIIPTHWSHSGDAASTWQDPTSPKWSLYGSDVALADAVFYAMGSNDIFASTTPTLADMQERTTTAVEIMHRMISPNVYGVTVTPRNGVTGAAETLRRQYNAWLTESGLFRDVFDLSAEVSADDETLKTEYDSGDGIHPNTAGYTAMAAAVNRPVVSV